MEETYAQQATAAPTAEAESTEALATVHKLKLRPPTYDGNYSTFEEWKYKFAAYMGIQDPTYPQLMERAERATSVLVEADLRTAAGTTQEAVLDTTVNKPQVHPGNNHIRISSNSSTTTSPRDRTWGIQTAMCQVLNTIGNKEHWLPNQTPEANI